ncbi:hypothetical protein [Echinimonas agarilytica]|uniref:Inner membrane protein n=1 Tax=Echinimonas agarilytica TaxID=1215918 RepID=A0AA42B756_9GAMM|nr:hypothetical protein [Echinimonas agarilytica]MCM2679552.1 hypothetical protein [Echinimonas agarilytica]
MDLATIEAFGYVGSVFVAVSLMMANIKKLRWINLLGAVIFTIYGAVIEAYPVMLLNGWICLTNMYYLWKIYSFKDSFSVVHSTPSNAQLKTLMLEEYKADILKFFPNYNDTWDEHQTIITLRNLKPVGLFIYRPISDEEITILVDYVTPDVRDMKNAKFLFYKGISQLKSPNLKRISAKSAVKQHQRYLNQLGFQQQQDDFVLTIQCTQ